MSATRGGILLDTRNSGILANILYAGYLEEQHHWILGITVVQDIPHMFRTSRVLYLCTYIGIATLPNKFIITTRELYY
jgi:hypothetical protein